MYIKNEEPILRDFIHGVALAMYAKMGEGGGRYVLAVVRGARQAAMEAQVARADPCGNVATPRFAQRASLCFCATSGIPLMPVHARRALLTPCIGPATLQQGVKRWGGASISYIRIDDSI